MVLKSLEALAPSTADPTSTDSSSCGRTTGKPSRKKYKAPFLANTRAVQEGSNNGYDDSYHRVIKTLIANLTWVYTMRAMD